MSSRGVKLIGLRHRVPHVLNERPVSESARIVLQLGKYPSCRRPRTPSSAVRSLDRVYYEPVQGLWEIDGEAKTPPAGAAQKGSRYHRTPTSHSAILFTFTTRSWRNVTVEPDAKN